MPIFIQSPHQRISQETKELVEEKFKRFNRKYKRIENFYIVLKKEKNQEQDLFSVEARLAVPGQDLFAHEIADSYAKAAQMVCVDLEGQIKKRKEKLGSKHVKPADELID